VLFLVDVLPRSAEDVRFSVTLDAVDRLDALRLALAELGLEGGWMGRATVEPSPDGALRVTAPGGGRSFVVRPGEAVAVAAEAAPIEVEAPPLEAGAPPVSDIVRPDAAVAPPLAEPVDADDLLLDESRLELYFADEEVPGEPVEPTPVARQAPAPARADTRELQPEPPSVDADERADEAVVALTGIEDFVYDIQGAMERVAATLLRPLCADVACVLLVDRKGQALGFAGLAGDAPARLSRYRYPRGLGLPWLAFDERRALLMNGIDRDLHLHREVLEKTGFRIRATVLAPIQSEGRTWGVVQAVRSAPDAPGFDEADLAVLEAVASRVGAYLALFGTYL